MATHSMKSPRSLVEGPQDWRERSWMLPSQAASSLNTTISRVHRLVRAGRLPALQVFGIRLVDSDAVLRFSVEQQDT